MENFHSFITGNQKSYTKQVKYISHKKPLYNTQDESVQGMNLLKIEQKSYDVLGQTYSLHFQ